MTSQERCRKTNLQIKLVTSLMSLSLKMVSVRKNERFHFISLYIYIFNKKRTHKLNLNSFEWFLRGWMMQTTHSSHQCFFGVLKFRASWKIYYNHYVKDKLIEFLELEWCLSLDILFLQSRSTQPIPVQPNQSSPTQPNLSHPSLSRYALSCPGFGTWMRNNYIFWDENGIGAPHPKPPITIPNRCPQQP